MMMMMIIIIINGKYSAIVGPKLSGPPAVPGCRRITVFIIYPSAECVCVCGGGRDQNALQQDTFIARTQNMGFSKYDLTWA